MGQNERDNGDDVEKTPRSIWRAQLGEVCKYKAGPLLCLMLMNI